MFILPIGFILTLIMMFVIRYSWGSVAYTTSSQIYALSLIFLVILPILLIITNIPGGDKNEFIKSPTRTEKVMVRFAKVLGILILIYFVLGFVID